MIYVDDRAGSVEMAPYFESHRSRPTVAIKRLIAGDFCFTGYGPAGPAVIGIERKRIKDMLSSIRTGRFSGEQLPKLLDYYEFPYLIVEGRIRTNITNGVLEEFWGKSWLPVQIGSQQFVAQELESFLSTIELHTRVKVHHAYDEHGTIEDALALHHYFSKPWEKHHAHVALHTPPEMATIGRAGTVRRVAAALKSIGWTRSAVVATRFQSVEDMVGATVKDWVKLDGFGKVLSVKVWKELHGESSEETVE